MNLDAGLRGQFEKREHKAMRRLQSLGILLFIVGIFSAAPAQDKKLTTVNLGYSAISGSFARFAATARLSYVSASKPP